MKLQKFLPVIAVVILLYYVCRQVQIRHKYVENLTEDRILSEAEVEEIRTYYRSIRENKPADPSKLSNKAKVFVNTVTAHPLTVITDSTLDSLSKVDGRPARKEEVTSDFISMSLYPIKIYQQKYEKSNHHRTRSQFVKEIEDIIKADSMIMGRLNYINDIMRGTTNGQREYLKQLRDLYVAGLGESVFIKNSDGTQSINMSGPLQTNLIDLAYAYLYPNQDIFSWILSLFSDGK